MHKWGIRTAAVGMALMVVGSVAPAASATEATAPAGEVPCEAIFGEYLCQQLSDTGQFVSDTADRVVPIVNETVDRVFVVTDAVYNLVKCTVQGTCPPL